MVGVSCVGEEPEGGEFPAVSQERGSPSPNDDFPGLVKTLLHKTQGLEDGECKLAGLSWKLRLSDKLVLRDWFAGPKSKC